MTGPFLGLDYLYVGVEDFGRALAYYRDVLGGELVWRFQDDGDEVGAVRLGDGPLVLLADHRPAGSTMTVWRVGDLKAMARTLTKRGWKPTAGPFEIPDGPCYTFADPDGNEVAIYEATRPGALAAEYRKQQARRGTD